jgi:hypothetical protein
MASTRKCYLHSQPQCPTRHPVTRAALRARCMRPEATRQVIAPTLTFHPPVPPEQHASYSAIIDRILSTADLNTISAKRIRKGLQDEVDYDLTPQKVSVGKKSARARRLGLDILMIYSRPSPSSSWSASTRHRRDRNTTQTAGLGSHCRRRTEQANMLRWARRHHPRQRASAKRTATT